MKDKLKLKSNIRMFSICLIGLFIFSVISISPLTSASVISTQEKSLQISQDVLGLKSNSANVTLNNYSLDLPDSYLGAIPQEAVTCDFTSQKGRIKVMYTYADNQLQKILVENLNSFLGSSSQKSEIFSPKINLIGANVFLGRYQKFTGDSFYKDLQSTLTKVDTKINQTISFSNQKLEVTTYEDKTTTYKWYYAFNGAIAPYTKAISLSFKNGQFTSFVDNWHLYNICNTNINLSKELAIDSALSTAKNHVWTVKVDSSSLESKNFNYSNVRWTALTFDNSVGITNARNNDSLALYPVWRIGLALDKWYGQMYGIEVDVWADTGKVRSVQEAWSTLPPSNNVPTANAQGATMSKSNIGGTNTLYIFSSVLMTFIVITVIARKKTAYTVAKPITHRTFAILLCILLSLSIVTSCLEVASATNGAVVWGSESIGAGDPSWRKSVAEIGHQRAVATNLESWFGNNGFSGRYGASDINHQGTDSSKTQILSDIEYLTTYRDYMAVVDFDHGVGGYPVPGYPYEFHYMFEDNRGEYFDGQNHYNSYDAGVYDTEIYPETSMHQTAFALINTCLSGNTYYGQGLVDDSRAQGLPFALMHRIVAPTSTEGFTINSYMSNNGYNSPDWGNQVFIGFSSGSAALDQRIPYDYGVQYYNWVNSFFAYALTTNWDVWTALNSACGDYWYTAFGNSPLTDFTSYWWNSDPQSDCSMVVYGNPLIQLSQYSVQDMPGNYLSWISSPATGEINSPCSFLAFSGDPLGHDVQYLFDWRDGTTDETGFYSDGSVVSASHSWSSGGIYNVRFKTRCPNSDWSDWTYAANSINIGSQTVYLSIDALDSYCWFTLHPNVYIDDIWQGTASLVVGLQPGYYKITVDDPVYNDNLGYYQSLVGFSDYGSNGDYRGIFDSTEICAYYW